MSIGRKVTANQPSTAPQGCCWSRARAGFFYQSVANPETVMMAVQVDGPDKPLKGLQMTGPNKYKTFTCPTVDNDGSRWFCLDSDVTFNLALPAPGINLT